MCNITLFIFETAYKNPLRTWHGFRSKEVLGLFPKSIPEKPWGINRPLMGRRGPGPLAGNPGGCERNWRRLYG
jgi:hypothetical protein